MEELKGVDHEENETRMLQGDLYYAFTPPLAAARQRCADACQRYNTLGRTASRRQIVGLWRDILNDKTPLPPPAPTPEQDDHLFDDDPWVDMPLKVDYGYNLRIGKGVYLNSNSTFLDTCTITIGARTLVGPNCSFYSGTHPLDPFLRNGIRGPELGKPIAIGEDCWFGGNVVVLPGVTIGRGATIGAGSVVTKDVPAFHCVAGNPARILKRIEVNSPDPTLTGQTEQAGAEALMAEQAKKLEQLERS